MVLQAVIVTLLFTCAASTLLFQRFTSSQPVCCYGSQGVQAAAPAGRSLPWTRHLHPSCGVPGEVDRSGGCANFMSLTRKLRLFSIVCGLLALPQATEKLSHGGLVHMQCTTHSKSKMAGKLWRTPYWHCTQRVLLGGLVVLPTFLCILVIDASGSASSSGEYFAACIDCAPGLHQ